MEVVIIFQGVKILQIRRFYIKFQISSCFWKIIIIWQHWTHMTTSSFLEKSAMFIWPQCQPVLIVCPVWFISLVCCTPESFQSTLLALEKVKLSSTVLQSHSMGYWDRSLDACECLKCFSSTCTVPNQKGEMGSCPLWGTTYQPQSSFKGLLLRSYTDFQHHWSQSRIP